MENGEEGILEEGGDGIVIGILMKEFDFFLIPRLDFKPNSPLSQFHLKIVGHILKLT